MGGGAWSGPRSRMIVGWRGGRTEVVMDEAVYITWT